MATVIDYAWSGPSPQQIKAASHQGVMRYISHDGGKDLSPAERDALRALGLTIGLVFESTAGRAKEGFGAGQADAAYANAHANMLGYPGNCTLWYAVDFDGTVAQVQAYFNGIGSVAGRAYAPYGGIKVIDGVTYPAAGWQTVAWSGGRVSARAGLLQNGFHGNYDTNQVLKPNYGQWGQQQGDDDMFGPGDSQRLEEVTNRVAEIDNIIKDGAHSGPNGLMDRIDRLEALVERVVTKVGA